LLSSERRDVVAHRNAGVGAGPPHDLVDLKIAEIFLTEAPADSVGAERHGNVTIWNERDGLRLVIKDDRKAREETRTEIPRHTARCEET